MSDDEAGENRDAHAQWSAICDYCGNTAGHYCKTCGIKLCSPCKDDHLSKRIYRHHEAVSYTSGVGPGMITQSDCSNHTGERYHLYCKPCKVPVCLQCIVENHNVRHKLMNIIDAFEDIKPKAISQLQTVSQTIRPRLQKELEGLSKSQIDILSTIAEIEQKMKDSAQHIHKEVDDILAENMKEIQKIKDDTIMPLLQEEMRKTKEMLDHFDEEILSYNKHLRSVDPVDLLKFMKERDVDSLDVASNQIDALLLLPSFTPGRISRESLQQQFGSLVIVDHTKPPTTSSISYSGESKGDNLDSDHNTEKVTNKHVDNKAIHKLIRNPVCEAKLTMKYDVQGLRLRSPNEAWVHGNGTTEFDLLERSGNVVRTVDAGCTLYWWSGMCVTDDGGLVYSDNYNQCIRSLSPRGQVSTLFTTEGSRPLGLCRLMSEELVVGMKGGVIRIYNDDGRVVREIKSKHVNNPYYITINKQTEDICVSDRCQKVVVLKKNGDHRFTYTGHGSDSRFDPHDLCSDRQGRLLITDHGNHRIHIVDQDGQFIQYLDTQKDGIQRPMSIDVDDRGYAWVGEWGSPKVKIIRYLQ